MSNEERKERMIKGEEEKTKKDQNTDKCGEIKIPRNDDGILSQKKGGIATKSRDEN